MLSALHRVIQPKQPSQSTYTPLCSLLIYTSALLALFALSACGDNELNAEQEAELRRMALHPDTPLPPSPTNSVADNLQAADLGKQIFFDRRMSNDGRVACVSCHLPDAGWSDPRGLSQGVGGATGDRTSMPSHGIAHQRFFFWDGRADSAWSQSLQAIESSVEMDFARTQVAHFIANLYREPYEAIFGPLPDLSEIPARAKPGDPAWDTLSDTQQDDVNTVFSNVGKLVEAYQRRLTCNDTRFDQWARGEAAMSAREEAGAATFFNEGCDRCHGGAAFSDGAFHNIGVPSNTQPNDTGRTGGLASLLDNPFNGAGKWSDDTQYGTAKLLEAMDEVRTDGAFRTPTLRGVTQRGVFGHAGEVTSVTTFIQRFYNRGGGGRGNNGPQPTVGSLDPLLNGVNVGGGDAGDITTFLGMLACPTPDPRWTTPPGTTPTPNTNPTPNEPTTPQEDPPEENNPPRRRGR